MLLQAYLYLWTMQMIMIQFETLPVLLILSNACSSSSSCRIWIMQAPALADLRSRSFIMIKFSRIVLHALAYKQLTKLLQVHVMFCSRHSSAVESNNIADMSLQSFYHANWPIKTRHFYSLSSKSMVVERYLSSIFRMKNQFLWRTLLHNRRLR